MLHIVLYSGGLDSFIALAFVNKHAESVDRVLPVYIPMGHRYQQWEEEAIRATVPETVIVHGMEGIGVLEDEDAYIHHRNAFLCLLASSKALDADEAIVWLTVQKDEMSIPDRTMEFLNQMSVLLNVLGQRIQVRTPFSGMDKDEMVEWYLSEGLDPAALMLTHSCYRPGIVPCGDCPACIRRYIAMSLNGLKEHYEVDPKKSPTGKEYLKRAQQGRYSEERNAKTIGALSDY